MRNARTATAVIAFLLSSFSVSASCPVESPSGYQVISYTGTNCASNFGGPCAIAQPVSLTLTLPYTSVGFESCDTATWHFGDGTSLTTAPGETTTTHSYASAGNYTVTTSVTNTFGTQASYYSSSIAVGAGNIFMTTSYAYVNEGAGTTVTVRRSNTTGTTSVNYATSDSSAVAGQQYVATSGTLTFADGEQQKTFTVATIDDHVFRTSQLQFQVTLSSPTSGYMLTSYTQMTVYITEMDPGPTLTFQATSYTVAENAGSLPVQVIRGGDLTKTVSVQYSVGYYYDTTSQTGLLSFLPNEVSKTITATITDDNVYNGDRITALYLMNPTNGAIFPNGSNYQYSVPLTIKENEPPPTITVQDLSIVEGSGLTNATTTISLSGPLGYVLYLQLIPSDGTAHYGRDYSGSFSTVTIPIGSTSASLPFQIIGNTKVETNKTFTLGAQAYCCNNNSLPTVPGKITILNDDASITPTHLSIARGVGGSIVANFGSPPATPQTVTLTSSDPSVASVPSSFTVNNPIELIPVTGKSGGPATITATVPAAYGGGTFSTDVYVYEGAVMVLSPLSVSVPIGGTATISASMSPALDATDGASLKATGIGGFSMPDRVLVDPGATATFTITGTKKGTAQLVATLGPNHGNSTTTIDVLVTDPVTTPTIAQITPANGPPAGGTAVTINGSNLRSECTIRFGGVPATNVAFVSASAMTATTPEHAAGNVDVTLSCGSDAFSFTGGFTYLSVAGSLSSVAPSFGTTAGNTVVRITGTNFVSGCWPFFDGMAAQTAVVNGPTEIVASTPVHPTAATVPLSLRCSGAVDLSLADAFTYSSAAESAPVITGVDPLVGAAGKPVTITGARFRYDDTVSFDTMPATVLSTSAGTHVVRIPELPLGKTSINVTDAGGRLSTTGPIFTIVEPPPPQIATVSPSSARPSNEITIDGSGFRPGYSFTIGDLPAAFVSMTYTRVVIRVPQLTAGPYGINILNSAAKVAVVGPQFSVLATGLSVKSVTPGCTMTTSGARITIGGTGFVSGAVVTIDGTIATGTVVVDAQTINVTLPRLSTGMPRITVTNPNGDAASLSNGLNVVSPFDPNGCAPRPRPTRH